MSGQRFLAWFLFLILVALTVGIQIYDSVSPPQRMVAHHGHKKRRYGPPAGTVAEYNPRGPMSKHKLPPYLLVSLEGFLVCSKCKEPLVIDDGLSISKAFDQHVRTMHTPEKPEDATNPKGS